MKRALLLVLLLAGCQEETAQAVDPLPLTEETVGYFCQMNLLEHEGPKAQIHLEGLPGMPRFFSQVRDAVAYMRMPEQSHPILAVWVNDMGAPGATWAAPGDNWIDAQVAYFVVGSARQGGMGAPELVPFGKAADAEAFAGANGGKVMRLAEIPDSAALAPVEMQMEDDADFQNRLKALSEQVGG